MGEKSEDEHDLRIEMDRSNQPVCIPPVTEVEYADGVPFFRDHSVHGIEHSAQIVKRMTLCEPFHHGEPSQQLGSNH